MRSFLRPLAALNAVAYLMAAVLSAALHTHAPRVHSSDEPAANACTSCLCGHHHHGPAEASESGETGTTPQSPDDHHDCVVCEFIAKAPLPVEPVRLVDVWTPVVTIPERELVSVPSTFLSHFWGRGPPVA